MKLALSRWLHGVALGAVLTLSGCGSPPMASHAEHPSTRASQSAVGNGGPVQLTRIRMVSPLDGWGLTATAVVRTDDGGKVWLPATPANLHLTTNALGVTLPRIAAAFPTKDEAVIVVENASGKAIHVYRTTNAGHRWTTTTVRVPRGVAAFDQGSRLSVQFSTAQQGGVLVASQGFAGTQYDAWLTTHDGGQQWHWRQNTPRNPTFEDVGVMGLNAAGFGVASVTVGLNSPRVLVTANGGRTWALESLPLPAGSSAYGVVQASRVTLGPSTAAWMWLSLVGERQPPQREWVFESTVDGGRHWQATPWTPAIPLSDGADGTALWVLSHRLLFFVANSHGTEIWQWTSDSSWHRVSHLPVEQIDSASFLPNGDGWIIGDTGNYQTTNGGATWQRFSPMLN
jgi:hypothetical protein